MIDYTISLAISASAKEAPPLITLPRSSRSGARRDSDARQGRRVRNGDIFARDRLSIGP
jgi:hypothetical protein